MAINNHTYVAGSLKPESQIPEACLPNFAGAMEKYRTCLFTFMILLLCVLPPSCLSMASSQRLRQPAACHDDERSALLEFQNDFKYPSSSYFAEEELNPRKLDSWKMDGGNKNCCSWDGVECDPETSHVIGLDLCCTGLYASINSSSSLFRLVHLRQLNLAYTDFSSNIPSAIGNLTRLTSLNLTSSSFRGQIPSQLLGLTNLSSLDLSQNSGLKFERPSLGDLLRSLTNLEELDLTWVNTSSSLTDFPKNLSALTSLILMGSGLHGRMPTSLFGHPNLRVLDMSSNFLSGKLPEFHFNSQLKYLFLYENDFSGELPASVSNLTQLVELDLSTNKLQGTIPCFSNGTQLESLDLSSNHFTGSLPSSLGNLFRIQGLELSFNHLTDQIPVQLSNLHELVSLDLSFNMISGTLEFDIFKELRNLEALLLNFNDLTVITTSNITTGRYPAKLSQLNLASCNLRTFPRILLKLDKLSILDLSANNIHGEVPAWFEDVARENLMALNLSSNSITGFSGNHSILSRSKLTYLDISFNNLQGPLPLPPKSIYIYRASNNSLSGEIPPLLCTRTSVRLLDLSKNNFTGFIPRCLIGNLTKTLSVLSLYNNNLQGVIPPLPNEDCSLRMLDLHHNQFRGPLPRSLSRCTMLEFLNFGGNMIKDTFPSWLGVIERLSILILQSNRFHDGIIEPSTCNSTFQALQIIDLSCNNFEGPLPAKYLQCWRNMKVLSTWGEYLGEDLDSPTAVGDMGDTYEYSMTIMNKGYKMDYGNILDYFQAVDFSSNNFSGEIPQSTANLTGLRLLNFSNNILTGAIPSFLGDMKNLEALDLSKNKLFGEIPEQLTKLTSLEFFDVSSNNLSGLIPRGTQFDTFVNTSNEGNTGLCGFPLSKACSDLTSPAPPSRSGINQDQNSSIIIEWKGVVVGYICAFVVATLVGNKIITVRPNRSTGISPLMELRR